MYTTDSFFTLSVPGQIGLAILSGILTIGMVVAARRLSVASALWMRMVLAMAMFVAFNWLSPQIYYTYYRMIIPGLPLQWVIATLPDFTETVTLLVFRAGDNLSAHGRGLLGWAMVVAAILPKRQFRDRV